ncbi:hypothetical protein PLICRDRAFT_616134 [Plicaturopsis crispa FD-325 SS-3]|nr:hypothetical protein PLICRDRAFT_616134 [Plicaturopsis crispa FD-325 SS-3]
MIDGSIVISRSFRRGRYACRQAEHLTYAVARVGRSISPGRNPALHLHCTAYRHLLLLNASDRCSIQCSASQRVCRRPQCDPLCRPTQPQSVAQAMHVCSSWHT